MISTWFRVLVEKQEKLPLIPPAIPTRVSRRMGGSSFLSVTKELVAEVPTGPARRFTQLHLRSRTRTLRSQKRLPTRQHLPTEPVIPLPDVLVVSDSRQPGK